MSDKPQKEATTKAAWATFSTDTRPKCKLMCTASYCVMVKSVSYCCACRSRLLSNLVTHTGGLILLINVNWLPTSIIAYHNQLINIDS